jgi:hypothetical protein
MRLVSNFSAGKEIGVPTPGPDGWGWEIVKFDTKAERVFRNSGIDLVTAVVSQGTHAAFARPSGPDQAVTLARELSNPQINIMLKLSNVAGQALAHHAGLCLIAPAVGAFAEKRFAELIGPAAATPEVLGEVQFLDVAADLKSRDLTTTVQAFAAGQIADRIKDRTNRISQQELHATDRDTANGTNTPPRGESPADISPVRGRLRPRASQPARPPLPGPDTPIPPESLALSARGPALLRRSPQAPGRPGGR